jgi:aspartyl-tRNA(Asn)/glutamyl-tRNA(Gln) amidotransferase subunit B
MYKVTIGLEVHCEVTTNTKNFSSAPNKFTKFPNEHVATVDLGLPGILPVANKEACRKSLLTSMALHCETPQKIVFDRKNYYYPDLPKGYQITQNTRPMGINGYLDILVGDEEKRVLIHDLHLEEDTASLEHRGNFSLIDYNRSGVPLMEIVTEPCISSAEEAVTFLEDLRDLFLYLKVSEARSDLGEMRCDVNISLSPDDTLGTKVEMKNINAFSSVKAAIDYEIKRQSELLDKGEKIVQETRRIAPDGKTYSMREKVDALDYKYFLEPNIPAIKLEDDYIEEIRSELPELKLDRVKRYMDLGIEKEDAYTLSKNRDISDYFDKVLEGEKDVKLAVNFMTTAIISTLNKKEISIDELSLQPYELSELIGLIEKDELSIDNGKKILYEAIDSKISPIELINKQNIKQINDDDELLKLINDLMDKNSEQVRQYVEEDNIHIINFFIGQVMKESNRQANPNRSKELIKEELERRKSNEK